MRKLAFILFLMLPWGAYAQTGSPLIRNNLSEYTPNYTTALQNLHAAGLASPQFTGTPKAPTSSNANQTDDQIATTAYVHSVCNVAGAPPTATNTSLGVVMADNATLQIGTGSNAGVMSIKALPIASATVLGGVKGGGIGIAIDAVTGVISSTGGYTLPIASASVLGGVKIGANISVNPTDGTISVAPPSGYTLPVGGSALGGVKNGGNVVIDSSGNMTAPSGGSSGPAAPAGPSARAPVATDDLNAGYVAGDIWVYNDSVWQNVQNSVGLAVWNPLMVGRALPLDAVGGVAPEGAYGMMRLTTAYTGPLFKARRTADNTTLDIPFLNDGIGGPDLALLDGLCSSACTIDTLYDQTTHARHATQATTAQQPKLDQRVTIGRTRAFFNDLTGSTTTPTGLLMPTSLVVGNTTQSMFILGQPYDVASGNSTGYAGLQNTGGSTSGTPNIGILGALSTPGIRMGSTTPPSLQAFVKVPGFSVPTLMGYTATAGTTGGLPISDDRAGPLFNNAMSVSTQAGGQLGYANQGSTIYQGDVALGMAVVYNRQLTTTEITTLLATTDRLFAAAPQVRDTLVFDGANVTFASNAGAFQGYASVVMKYFGQTLRGFNVAVNGRNATNTTNAMSNWSSLIKMGGKNNIIVVNIGGVDLLTNGNNSNIYTSQLTPYVTAAHTAGYKVAMTTVLPRSDLSGTKDTQRTGLNTLITGNAAGADAIIDLASEPTMGVFANTANTTYYVDGVVPTALGAQYLAPLVITAVKGLLQ